MTQSEIVERTRAYLRENFLYMRPNFVLADDDLLLKKGVIDSMGVMELIEFLRGEFGVTIADADITEENLGSLTAIARYVLAKRGTAVSPT